MIVLWRANINPSASVVESIWNKIPGFFVYMIRGVCFGALLMWWRYRNAAKDY